MQNQSHKFTVPHIEGTKILGEFESGKVTNSLSLTQNASKYYVNLNVNKVINSVSHTERTKNCVYLSHKFTQSTLYIQINISVETKDLFVVFQNHHIYKCLTQRNQLFHIKHFMHQFCRFQQIFTSIQQSICLLEPCRLLKGL